MGTWIKETDAAVYLMDGAYYLEKIDKRPHTGDVEGETVVETRQLRDWLNQDEAPGFMLVSVGTGTSEPLPVPTTPPPSRQMTVTQWPASPLKTYQAYEVTGTASDELVGQQVELYVDGSPVAKTQVESDNSWTLRSIFIAVPSPRQRQLKVTIAELSETKAIILTPYIEPHPGAKDLRLTSSVGYRGRNNVGDVRQVRERLRALGYDFVKSNSANDLVQAIRLFQSIILGSTKLRGDGRVDPGGMTQAFLEASNAPQWMKMPAQGTGFRNEEVMGQPYDYHDYGTDWTSNVIRAAGVHYELAYRRGRSSIAPIVINDVSLPKGGDTRDHSGHESGNAVDLMLPRKGGNYGGITWRSSAYDRAAAEATLRALRVHPWVDRNTLYFNDPQLMAKRLCRYARGHDNHIHFEVDPPARL